MSSAGYLLDGLDLYDTYGVTVVREKGYYGFLERKDPKSQSWEDEDGEDAFVTSDDIYFEPRTHKLYCVMEATNNPQMTTRWRALKVVLYDAGLKTVRFMPKLGAGGDLSVYYNKATMPEKLTDLSANLIVMRFTIEFIEPSPSRTL